MKRLNKSMGRRASAEGATSPSNEELTSGQLATSSKSPPENDGEDGDNWNMDLVKSKSGADSSGDDEEGHGRRSSATDMRGSLFSGVTKGMTSMTKGAMNVTTGGIKGVTSVTKGVTSVTTSVTKGAMNVTTGGIKGVTSGVKGGVKGVGKVGTTLGKSLRVSGAGREGDEAMRPSYTGYGDQGAAGDAVLEEEEPSESHHDADQDEHSVVSESRPTDAKAKHIESSAGTSRLNRILMEAGHNPDAAFSAADKFLLGSTSKEEKQRLEKVQDVTDAMTVGNYAARLVIPPLRVDPWSIGGSLLSSGAAAGMDGAPQQQQQTYPENMVIECLACLQCHTFESTGVDSVVLTALQYPNDYAKFKRMLGLGGVGGKSSNRAKLRFVLMARATNRPCLRQQDISSMRESAALRASAQSKGQRKSLDESSERDDYDTMFGPEDDSVSRDDSSSHPLVETPSERRSSMTSPQQTGPDPTIAEGDAADAEMQQEEEEEQAVKPREVRKEEEISSFPVLICMNINADGSAPDIRKLIPMDQLSTIQDLHSTVVQLAFANGDTVRLDFGGEDEEKAVEGSMDKERFIWSLLQIHAMLCVSVFERNSMESIPGRERKVLPILNVLNLDRAELQYVATVNGFLQDSPALCILLDRQRSFVQDQGGFSERGDDTETKEDAGVEEMDEMAYDLMMGNFATRVAIFHSEEERKDAEEILNSTEWVGSLSKEETAAISVAERLGFMLQCRMRDLEAETCRRLIAWEDEKQHSSKEKATFMGDMDERDTVDALALASLFKTLESLDTELQGMEDWLQERATAIKPLTDDCADIEEENRALEQQFTSYDMLGAEMRRLLQGLEIDEDVEAILRNPASVLVYDPDGAVDIDESEAGLEQIYEAGKTLQEALEFPRRSGGLHLKAIAERAQGLQVLANIFCKSLARIIVTVMEQSKSEVVAGSDHGKVSKSDTHAMIAKKVRDTQRKFQSALLGYIKLVEVMAAINPDMLPAMRDAYSEMVSEGILMKKRMKGYFQALPGQNSAYLNKVGKDLKDYAPSNDEEVFVVEELVNTPDIRAALSELLPVIAREAYFTSALFGVAGRDQEGREKKRNFENTRKAVDNSSQHFRYYVNRTCGIVPGDNTGKAVSEIVVKGDPLLCCVASICLNEAMDSYIDREKKGGDHSLSLAYVRATILDLRKKADKQWVVWVDKQIEWIRSHDGVPLSGKRAGIFPSFSRFPLYLDHLLLCCRDGRGEGYTPDITSIKVVSYYLQKMANTLLESLQECANRETTDQQYAANVMRMENSYFLSQALKDRGEMVSTLFAKQLTKANAICKDSTDSYLGWMIKREFTALHELFSRVSKVRKDMGDREVMNHVPKNVFVKSLSKEANRVVMKEKISLMYNRMEKHLCEEGNLLPVAWKALVKVLFEWFGRWEKLSSHIYGHKLDPSAVEIVRIAKAAGGAAKPKVTAEGAEFGFFKMSLGNKK